MEERIRVARIAPHLWEEPCISGSGGSGTVFFVGCTLHCVYCQNHEISRPKGTVGTSLTIDELSDEMLRLQDDFHVHNINLVTASHVANRVIRALQKAKEDGLRLPVVWNTSGYESPETLSALDGLIDVYLPDLKYVTPALAEELSGANDYPDKAKAAIAEMVRQTGAPVFDADGLLVRGVLVRHLVLPGHTQEAKNVLQYLHETYGDSIWISILGQYTPMPGLTGDLARTLTAREYDRVIDYACLLGIENAFLQEEGAADERFIPAWEQET